MREGIPFQTVPNNHFIVVIMMNNGNKIIIKAMNLSPSMIKCNLCKFQFK
jgi:hypothetical protein